MIKEVTVVTTYNLTQKQKDWLAGIAAQRGLTASDVLREILNKEMQRQGELS